MVKWIEDNGLKINVSKTQLLVLSPPRRQEHAKTIKICLKGEEIVQQEKVKYLGGQQAQLETTHPEPTPEVSSWPSLSVPL